MFIDPENLRFWNAGRQNAGQQQARKIGLRTLALVCLSVFCGCIFEMHQQGPVILFMGNSITLNLPVPDLAWSGHWGMAASSMDNDYVHQTTRILKEKGLALEPIIAQRNCPDCDGALDEQIHNMEQVRKLKPHYVVVQLSEHSGDIELRSGKMTAQYFKLLSGLRAAGVLHVYCLGSWGEKAANDPHNEGIWQALKAFPEYAFVDISRVAADTANYGDTKLFGNAAVLWHPGDGGMLGIAQVLSQAIWESQ
jgi:hypothetical protein